MNQTAKMDARSKDTMRATTNVPIVKQIDNAMYAYTPRFNRSLNFALQSHDWGNSPKWLQLSAIDPRMSMLQPRNIRCRPHFLMPLEIGEDGQDDDDDGNGTDGDFASPLHSRYLLGSRG